MIKESVIVYRQDTAKSGINNRGEATGVFYGCRAVLTPTERINGRTEEDLRSAESLHFALLHRINTAYFYVPAINVEHALPIKNATKKAMPKPSAVRQLTLLSLTVKHAGEE